ncbi:MAG: hypothetical protein ACM3N9_07125 [Syntrophothermus sp.]
MKQLLLLVILLPFFISCTPKNNNIFQYHKFQGDTWNRFDKVSFTIPVMQPGKYDVFLEAYHNQAFDRNAFSINMIMNTPSGEERINEYNYEMKDKLGKFRTSCTGDSCKINIALKKSIILEKGELKLEIENLIPYIETSGLKGIGIRVIPLK